MRSGTASAEQSGEQHTDGTAAPAEKVKVGDVEVPVEQFKEVLARMGIEQSGKATAPTTAEGYQLALPETFQAPLGADGRPLEIKLDPESPLARDARAVAHKHGISQAAFSDFVQVFAADKINQQQQFQTAFNTEVAKLGPAAGQRIDAITTFYKGLLGKNASAITNNIWTADMVKAHEAIINRFANQGAGGFSQSHREPGDGAAKLTEEQWGRMSSGERLDYARASSAGRR